MDYTQTLDIRRLNPETEMSQIAQEYQDIDKLQLQADRYIRGKAGMEEWARIAKRCYEMVEDAQWTPEMLAEMAEKGRAAFAWNEIKALVMMIIGYQSTVKTDLKLFPEWQGLVGLLKCSLNKQLADLVQLLL